MSDQELIPDTEKQSRRHQIGSAVGSFLKQQALKGKLKLEHSVGLGSKPNVIPPGEASIDGELRTVEIGWHPVAGLGENGWLSRRDWHWAVLVDDYVHQLWMDENLDVIYINEKLDRSQWHTFTVGKTRFNDEALRQTGEMTIHKMRAKQPAYNLISNNCQNFALAMLDAIQIGAHKEFATSFAVYQRATGKGAIKDLFVDKHPEEQQQHAVEEQQEDNEERPPRLQHQNTMQTAQQVMDENTTKLDKHHHGSLD